MALRKKNGKWLPRLDDVSVEPGEHVKVSKPLTDEELLQAALDDAKKWHRTIDKTPIKKVKQQTKRKRKQNRQADSKRPDGSTWREYYRKQYLKWRSDPNNIKLDRKRAKRNRCTPTK